MAAGDRGARRWRGGLVENAETELNKMNDVGLLRTFIDQMQNWPSSVTLCLMLLALGAVLKISDIFPDKWIPITIMLLGGSINVVIGDVSNVPPDQRNPLVVLFMFGFLLGTLAWVLRHTALKRLVKFLPLPPEKAKNNNGKPTNPN